MSQQIAEYKVYPEQEVAGGRWSWVMERIRPSPGRATLKTKPEAREVLNRNVQEAHAKGFEVHASFIDQTGGGHRGIYFIDGRMVEEPIPAITGDIGARCSPLTRGTDQKGNGAGGQSASARRKTLASRRTWDALYDALVAGALKIGADGRVAKSTAKGAKGVVADLGDFTYIAARIMARGTDVKSIGSFPGTFALPARLLGSDAPKQRTEAEVLARVGRSPKPQTPKAPTPKAPTPKPARQRRPRQAKPPKQPTPKAPTPKAPTPKAPTPKAPTPKAPTPKAPTPKAPTPKAPTPKAPVRRPRPVTLPAPTEVIAVSTPQAPQKQPTPRMQTPRQPTPRQPTPRQPAPADARSAAKAELAGLLGDLFA